MRRLLPLLLLMPALAHGARWSDAEVAGLVTDPAMAEISGLAASRAHPGLYWTHNDGGNRAELHVMDGSGHRRATLKIAGVKNIDWEDLASFTLDGRHYLAIADTGDNGGLRESLRVIVVEEPAVLRDGESVKPAWRIRFRWPDGPRDCEAMAVDAAHGDVLLVSKKRVPPELFRLPLRPAKEARIAELLGQLPGIAQPTPEDLAKTPVYGRYRSQVTATDLSPNGQVLAVLNYRALYFYVRRPGTGWSDALTGTPGRLMLPWLPQAAAVAFSLDGHSLLIGSEQLPAPLLRYRVLDDTP